jgi:hypothetical protein
VAYEPDLFEYGIAWGILSGSDGNPELPGMSFNIHDWIVLFETKPLPFFDVKGYAFDGVEVTVGFGEVFYFENVGHSCSSEYRDL